MTKNVREAWKLIEELEKDNDALKNAARNAIHIKDKAVYHLRHEIVKLKRRNHKLKSDNEFLRKLNHYHEEI
jgi:uncharacterized protein YacL (UPF0231 family)